MNIRLHTSRQKKRDQYDFRSKPLLVVPYVQQISNKIKQSLIKYNIKTVFNNKKKNNINFDKLKDKDNINIKSGIV